MCVCWYTACQKRAKVSFRLKIAEKLLIETFGHVISALSALPLSRWKTPIVAHPRLYCLAWLHTKSQRRWKGEIVNVYVWELKLLILSWIKGYSWNGPMFARINPVSECLKPSSSRETGRYTACIRSRAKDVHRRLCAALGYMPAEVILERRETVLHDKRARMNYVVVRGLSMWQLPCM